MRGWVVPAILALALALGCAEDPLDRPAATTVPDSTTGATTAPVAPDGSAHEPFPVGRPVGIDHGWTLEVPEAAGSPPRTDPEPWSKPTDALVVAVSLEMSYLGQGEGFAMQALNDLKAVGPSRRLYRYYRGHCTDDLLWQLKSLTHGERISGQVCFMVDRSDVDDLVMFLDVSPDRERRTFFALR